MDYQVIASYLWLFLTFLMAKKIAFGSGYSILKHIRYGKKYFDKYKHY